MDLYFSEFSYGYAVTQEFENFYAAPLKAAPIFPSLQNEGTKGYDVELIRRGIKPDAPGIPLFLQFKLAERIERRFNGRIDDAYYSPPFYRVKLRTRRPNQHELLVRLDRQGKEVYYVAPGFHRSSDLNENFSTGSVVANSVLVTPGALGRFPEGERHHFSFKAPSEGFVRRFSESDKVINTTHVRSIIDHHRELILSEPPGASLLNLDTLATLEHEMFDAAGGEGLVEGLDTKGTLFPDQISRRWRELGLLNRIGYIARVAFECAFFVIGISEAETGQTPA